MPNSSPTHKVQFAAAADRLSTVDQEWLLTNGLGAYAQGTLPGVNTRRYHGLLVACKQPPLGRVLAVNQLFEQIVLPGEENSPIETTACAFRDGSGRTVFAPAGHQWLIDFEKGLSVAWTYQTRGVTLTRRLRLHWKQQAATVSYTIKLPETMTGQAIFRVAPMLTLRDFHGLLLRGSAGAYDASASGDRLTVKHNGNGSVTARLPGAAVEMLPEAQRWWYGLYYAIETDRGQDDHEDHFVPARFVVRLAPGKEQQFALTLAWGDAPAEPALDDKKRGDHLAPIQRRLAFADAARPGAARMLAIAADDFVVARTINGAALSTILAGYPWFSDWGRDTFIALPGLLLATGRFDEARATLQAFARNIRDGLVPNCFDDHQADNAVYNTVDASLWFIHAAMEYLKATDDQDAWEAWLGGACRQIVDAYIKGTRFDIRMAGDGLISAGNARTQLTWMDAACGGRVFTPRNGKAVEINALWFHALTGLAELFTGTHKPVADHYKKLAGRVSRSFAKVFWDEELGCLRDCVALDAQGNDVADRSIRPNQIFVASLPHSPLPRTRQRQVLNVVRQKLLTPYGLRTLPEDDPRYHPDYRGPQFQRDGAYHQGTIWPWLIGPYAQAVLRVDGFSDKSKAQALAAIQPLLDFLAGPGLGQLFEIHEGRPPHRPVGCPAQAWSVAQVIDVLALVDRGA